MPSAVPTLLPSRVVGAPPTSSASAAPGSVEMRAELAPLCSISQEERFLTPGQH